MSGSINNNLGRGYYGTISTNTSASTSSTSSSSSTGQTSSTTVTTTPTTSVTDTKTTGGQKYTLTTLKKTYKLTDDIISKYFEEVKGSKNQEYKLNSNCGYNNVSELMQDLYEEYQNMLILNNFMSGNVSDTNGKETAAMLKRTFDGKVITAKNFTQYADEIGKASPEDADKLRKEALNQLISKFTSGDLAISQVRTILNAIGVTNVQQKSEGDNYVISFKFGGKQYNITCNKKAAESGKDDIKTEKGREFSKAESMYNTLMEKLEELNKKIQDMLENKKTINEAEIEELISKFNDEVNGKFSENPINWDKFGKEDMDQIKEKFVKFVEMFNSLKALALKGDMKPVGNLGFPGCIMPPKDKDMIMKLLQDAIKHATEVFVNQPQKPTKEEFEEYFNSVLKGTDYDIDSSVLSGFIDDAYKQLSEYRPKNDSEKGDIGLSRPNSDDDLEKLDTDTAVEKMMMSNEIEKQYRQVLKDLQEFNADLQKMMESGAASDTDIYSFLTKLQKFVGQISELKNGVMIYESDDTQITKKFGTDINDMMSSISKEMNDAIAKFDEHFKSYDDIMEFVDTLFSNGRETVDFDTLINSFRRFVGLADEMGAYNSNGYDKENSNVEKIENGGIANSPDDVNTNSTDDVNDVEKGTDATTNSKNNDVKGSLDKDSKNGGTGLNINNFYDMFGTIDEEVQNKFAAAGVDVSKIIVSADRVLKTLEKMFEGRDDITKTELQNAIYAVYADAYYEKYEKKWNEALLGDIFTSDQEKMIEMFNQGQTAVFNTIMNSNLSQEEMFASLGEVLTKLDDLIGALSEKLKGGEVDLDSVLKELEDNIAEILNSFTNKELGNNDIDSQYTGTGEIDENVNQDIDLQDTGTGKMNDGEIDENVDNDIDPQDIGTANMEDNGRKQEI